MREAAHLHQLASLPMENLPMEKKVGSAVRDAGSLLRVVGDDDHGVGSLELAH